MRLLGCSAIADCFLFGLSRGIVRGPGIGVRGRGIVKIVVGGPRRFPRVSRDKSDPDFSFSTFSAIANWEPISVDNSASFWALGEFEGDPEPSRLGASTGVVGSVWIGFSVDPVFSK